MVLVVYCAVIWGGKWIGWRLGQTYIGRPQLYDTNDLRLSTSPYHKNTIW